MTTAIHKKDRKQGSIFGIPLNSTSKERVLAEIAKKLSKQKKVFITTPNPEIVLLSKRDKNFKKILRSSDFSIPDGVGLSQAIYFLGMKAPRNLLVRFFVLLFQGLVVAALSIFYPKKIREKLETIKGRELFLQLVSFANDNKLKVFLLGGEEDEAEKTADYLKKKYTNLKIKSDKGPILKENGKIATKGDSVMQKKAIDKINATPGDFLFVAFGAPKQEKWIARNKGKLNVKLIMGVGGTFRYLSGKAKLPPRSLGHLEWVFRLFTEPKRFKRVFTAFPLFPLAVFWEKLTS